MSPKNDPIIARLGARAVEPVSYQEVPATASPALRALSAAVTARVETMNAWKKALLRGVMPDDVVRYRTGNRPAASMSDPTIDLGGPSAQVSAFWLRTDHAAPSIPGDITWTSKVALTPRELIAETTVSAERLMDLFTFDQITDGVPTFGERADMSPIVVTELADAIARAEAVAFIRGAGSTTDPIAGLASNATITAQAAGTTPYIDDATAAVTSLRALGRYPNAILIGPSLARVWRSAKATTGGSYLFDPAAPMSIDGVPVYEHYGIPAGASTYAFVGDFSRVVMLHRLLPGGLLYRVDWSDLGASFATDSRTFRVFTRWDAAVTPGYGPSIVKITGINAP